MTAPYHELREDEPTRMGDWLAVVQGCGTCPTCGQNAVVYKLSCVGDITALRNEFPNGKIRLMRGGEFAQP